MQNGYLEDELYASSYGPPCETVMPKHGGVHCFYVKQVHLKKSRIMKISFKVPRTNFCRFGLYKKSNSKYCWCFNGNNGIQKGI